MRSRHPNWYHSWYRRQVWHMVSGLRMFLFGVMVFLKIFALLLLPLALIAAICVGLAFVNPYLLFVPLGVALLLLCATGMGAMYHEDNSWVTSSDDLKFR